MILGPYTCREALHWLSNLSSPFLTSSEEQLSSARRTYVVQTSLTFISGALDLAKSKFWIYQTTAPHPLLSTLRSLRGHCSAFCLMGLAGRGSIQHSFFGDRLAAFLACLEQTPWALTPLGGAQLKGGKCHLLCWNF